MSMRLCGFLDGQEEDALQPVEQQGVRQLLPGGFGVALALGSERGAVCFGGCVGDASVLLASERLLCGAGGYDWGLIVTDTPPEGSETAEHTQTCFGFGANTHGQALGGVDASCLPGRTSARLASPTAFTLPLLSSPVRKVACGERHALCLLEDGTLLGWGDNGDGQLAGGESLMGSCVRVLQLPAPAVDIAAGARHSLAALSGARGVAACGWGMYGQRGDGDALAETPVAFAALPGLAGVACVAVAAGLGHSLCLTSDGSLYSWGWNESGQLGIGPPAEAGRVLSTPQLLECAELEPDGGRRVVYISCGSRHSACLRSDGAAFTWGWGAHGQLGRGGREDAHEPRLVLRGCAQVECGWWHTAFLVTA